MRVLNTLLDFEITPQPDDITCGPSSLHAVYRHYGLNVPIQQVIEEVPQLELGGTLAVHLGIHALRRGFRADIYTCDLQMFDPSWFKPDAPTIRERLLAQREVKRSDRLAAATEAYLTYLDLGGQLHMEDVTVRLLARLLRQGTPIITGLSATWLYKAMRERPADNKDDDLAGEPVGHFVVIHGVDTKSRRVAIADPSTDKKPFDGKHNYEVDAARALGAIMLGIVTNDAKLLIVQPNKKSA